MDIKSTLTNPWVIGGALAVGALVLFMPKGGAAPVGNTSALLAMNQSASQQFAASTAARVALGSKAYDTSATVAGYFAGALTNISNVQGQVRMAQAQSNAGIISSLFTSDAALAADIATNSARVNQTGIVTAGQVVASTAGARYSQEAAKSAASAGLFASIAGSVASVANNAIRAAS